MLETTISGVGESPPSRQSNTTAHHLAVAAIRRSLDDACLKASDIDAVVTEAQICPHLTPLDRIAKDVGLTNIRVAMQSSPVGAGILAAIAFATELVASGKANHVLTYFAIDWGTSSNGPSAFHQEMKEKDLFERPTGFLAPALYFATITKRYQHIHGLSDSRIEELLSNVVLAARANAAGNPGAQQKKPLDLEGYRASPMIAEPLHTADCALLSDGAGALVISRRDLCGSINPQVSLRGWSYDHEPQTFAEFYTQNPHLPDLPATTRASKRAFAAAGLTPQDMDMFQLYDCFSISPVLQMEAIGGCPRGQSAEASGQGAWRHDGATPVNTHGGLLCHGHVFGINHAIEAVRQLRGQAGSRQVRNAQRAFVGAGPGRQYSALILERGRAE